MFPDEVAMIVKNRIPHKAIRARKDYYAVSGEEERDIVKHTDLDLLPRDGIGDGGGDTGGRGDGSGRDIDFQSVPDFDYPPDYNAFDCPELQNEIDRLAQWRATNQSYLTPAQETQAFQKLQQANILYTSKCASGGGVRDLGPIDGVVCDQLLSSATITGKPTYIKVDVVFPSGVDGFAYDISKNGGGYNKTGNVNSNTVSINETIPAGTYTAQLRAMCGTDKTSTQVLTQEFTVTADAATGIPSLIPVIPIANVALPKSTATGGGGGGAAPAAKKAAAPAVKPKSRAWLWWLLIATAGGTYYLYKKNKKK